jgi:flagellar biosynthetic protein FlhB
MSKRDGKTELPTEKKKKDSRKKGTIAKSADLAPWVAVLVASYFVPRTVASVGGAAIESFAEIRTIAADPDPRIAIGVLTSGLWSGFVAMMPILGLLALVGMVASAVQGGVILSLKPLKPDWRRIDPISGTKRLFSTKSLWDTAKQFTKAGIITWLAWPHVQRVNDELVRNGRIGLIDGMEIGGQALLGAVRAMCWAVLVVALLDYGFQRRQTLLDLKMTKQEVRDEYRNTEGDPMVKSRIRQLQASMAKTRMMQDVPTASVVVTNPTHLAIALRYDAEAGGAPRIVAAGADAVAAKIREKAIAAGVPIVEAKPLARALWRQCDIGDEIPVHLYEAVAKVLAFVRRLRGGIGASSAMPLPRQYHVDAAWLESLPTRRTRRGGPRRRLVA